MALERTKVPSRWLQPPELARRCEGAITGKIGGDEAFGLRGKGD